MAVLSNDVFTVSLSETGTLESLRLHNGPELVKPHQLWSLAVSSGDCGEIELLPCESEAVFEDDGFVITSNSSCDDTGKIWKTSVIIRGKLLRDRLALSIEIANCDSEIVSVTECRFPIIKLSDEAEKFAWRNSQQAGTVHPSISGWKDAKLAAQPGYQGLDELFKREILHYPGKMATTNSFILDGGECGLYFGSHDKTFQTTLHIAQANVPDATVDMMMVKLPFIKSRQTFKCEDFILAPYSGTWHRGADIYKEFLHKNIELPQIPESLEFFSGWERIIMRTQYGNNLFMFRDLPEIAAELKECHVDALLIFGWHSGGHDNDYPNYTVSESLGGYDAFKTAISEVRKLGIKVNLYTNGQLIDRTSEFYRSGAGKRCAIHDIRGVEEFQRWGFSGKGIYNSCFGGRTFSRACPCADEMTKILLNFIDLASDLGADGVFFDQLGSGDPICFNPDHGHPVPFTTIMTARRDMLLKLRSYAHSKNLTIGIEHASDITAGCVDYVHSFPGGAAVRGKIVDGVKPFIPTDFEYFRYVFPEAQISNREIRDDNDIERRVNRMLLFGLQCDVEIKRCRATIGTTPHYKEYLTKVLEFKNRNRRYLEGGVFRSTSDLGGADKDIDVAGFALPDGSYTIIATQSHLESAVFDLAGFSVDNCRHTDFIGKVERSSDNTFTLAKDAVLLLNLKKL